MGFSVSGSAAIVFIGVIVAVGIAVPSIVGSLGSLAGAQGEQTDRGIEALNTELVIENTSYDAGNQEIDIRAKNSGSTSLSVNETSVIVDGRIPTNENVTTDVEGNTDASLWLPGETLNVTVSSVDQQPDRVKLVTENGIAQTAGVGG